MLGRAKIKERLNAGGIIIGAMLRFPDPSIAEILALAGVDILTIDNEHYPFDDETLISIVRVADAHNMACIVRVSDVDSSRIARIMDCGVDGIHLATVDTYEEARGLVDAVKYEPAGRRGFCPITRAASYGLSDMSWKEYAEFANKSSIIIAQIETRKGIENLDMILSIDEIDIFTSGASDLAASYGYIGQNDHPVVKRAVEEFKQKVKAAGKQLFVKGTTPEELQQLLDEGIKLIGIGSDQQILMEGCKNLIHAVRDNSKNGGL